MSDTNAEEVYNRLNRELLGRLDRLNHRIVLLDEQIRVNDRIIRGINSRYDLDGYESSSSSEVEVVTRSSHGYEREDYPDSSDDSTVAYNAFDHGVLERNPYDSDDDSETVVEEWTDPFITPVRRELALGQWYMEDLDDGLDILDDL